MRRGDNHIRHSRDDDVQTVYRNGRAIPGNAKELFVNDNRSTTWQINRLIRLTRYRDNHTVNAEVGKRTTLASGSTRFTRALRTYCHNVGGNVVATHIQIQIIDNGLRPALIAHTLSFCVEKPSYERAV